MYLEIFNGLRDRTTMFVPNRNYNVIVAFITGYDIASDNKTLQGFSKWLTYKYKAPNNFVFSQQVKFIFQKGDIEKILSNDKEQELIDFLFLLFFEFEAEREEKGLEYIYNEYKNYINNILQI